VDSIPGTTPFIRIIPVFRGIRNAAVLLGKGDWQGFKTRLRIALGHIDLKLASLEEVNLSGERAHYYADSGGLELESILRAFDFTPEDEIVDFGCGKGGVLITLARYPFSKITGVEISPDLAAIARENLRKLELDRVEVRCCDAADFRDLDDYNYFYFFDPFPCAVMKEVIRNIENSINKHPRKVTLIYLNPNCHAEIEASSVLYKIRELEHFQHDCFIYTNEGN
jgi:SAM-dependent methyltransferase